MADSSTVVRVAGVLEDGDSMRLEEICEAVEASERAVYNALSALITTDVVVEDIDPFRGNVATYSLCADPPTTAGVAR
ncbi:hypothetical protein EFA46_015985 (plasmid) [Halarchaeum sp. CBA1220]|uniref:hypothetical protein n=1 Tax=Halarchaeum sp. CBA1220 TaxID=1853682 RepID=UPI0015A334FC|nr:hypothetical protein [Halarchaeum sp. CBA1220]QLC35757.1 hypothetical protein EFA46_015985 [Halarchaeum sp. CBA1220]